MGKTKNRHGSEVEYLRGEVRRLKKHIRQLEKREHAYETAFLDEKEIEIEEVKLELICNECGKGKLKHFELLGRFFEECTVCDHRKKIK